MKWQRLQLKRKRQRPAKTQQTSEQKSTAVLGFGTRGLIVWNKIVAQALSVLLCQTSGHGLIRDDLQCLSTWGELAHMSCLAAG